MLEKDIRTEKLEKPGAEFKIEKKRRMDKLDEKLRELDEKRNDLRWEDSKNRITFQYDEKAKDEKKFSCVYNNKEYKLTLGDIMADYNWGLKYRPEQNMPQNIYRQISKRILTNETRREIEKIYDKELVEKDIVDPRIAKLQDESIERQDQSIIAEAMVREFMIRLSYISDLEFKILRSSKEDDIHKKMDFKIIFMPHKRGIKTIDEDDFNAYDRKFQKLGLEIIVLNKSLRDKAARRYLMTKRSGIEAAKRKYKDFLDVDDIVLVPMQIKESKQRFYVRWLSDGKPPGGPEKYLPLDKKKEIFKTVTQGFNIDISDGELEKLLQ